MDFDHTDILTSAGNMGEGTGVLCTGATVTGTGVTGFRIRSDVTGIKGDVTEETGVPVVFKGCINGVVDEIGGING